MRGGKQCSSFCSEMCASESARFAVRLASKGLYKPLNPDEGLRFFFLLNAKFWILQWFCSECKRTCRVAFYFLPFYDHCSIPFSGWPSRAELSTLLHGFLRGEW
jgi:hypothetical protein